MQAHIRFDLPRAIAAAYEANYAGIPGLSMGAFRADFDKMGPVFDRANEALLPEIDGYTNRDVRPDPGSWHWLQGVGFPFLFNIPLERNQAWEKADAIFGGHEKGITDPAVMQERLQAYMTAAHPFSGSEAFEVDGNKVKDYPFGTAPPAK